MMSGGAISAIGLESTNRLILHTLNSWIDLIVDCSIIYSLQKHNVFDELCVDENISVKTSTLKLLVLQKVSKETNLDLVHDTVIETRIQALLRSGILGFQSTDSYYLQIWGTYVTKEGRCLLGDGVCEESVVAHTPSYVANRFRYMRTLPTDKNIYTFKWMHRVIKDIDRYNISLSDYGVSKADTAEYRVSTARELATNRHICKSLAEALPKTIIILCAYLFHDLVIKASADPLVEHGLEDWLACFCATEFQQSKPLHLGDQCGAVNSPNTVVSINGTTFLEDTSHPCTPTEFESLWHSTFLLDVDGISRLQKLESTQSSLWQNKIGEVLVQEIRNDITYCNKKCYHIPILKPFITSSKINYSKMDFMSFEHRVKSFYEIYAPTKADATSLFCERYKYNRSTLVHLLHVKYKKQHYYLRSKGRFIEFSFSDFFITLVRIFETVTLPGQVDFSYKSVQAKINLKARVDGIIDLEDIASSYLDTLILLFRSLFSDKSEGFRKDNISIETVTKNFLDHFFSDWVIRERC